MKTVLVVALVLVLDRRPSAYDDENEDEYRLALPTIAIFIRGWRRHAVLGHVCDLVREVIIHMEAGFGDARLARNEMFIDTVS